MSFLIALILGLALTPLARAIGLRLGFVDRPTDELKIHRTPVPILGGVAVCIATMAAAAVVGWRPLAGVWASLALAVAVALAVGMADDLRGLPVWPRAGLQAVAGALAGVGLVPGRPQLAAVVGALLGVACANAVNMLDGQDGLAGSVAGLSALGLAGVAALLDPVTETSLLPLAAAGACAAFLVWNRPPASIFLGDGGAYGLGVILAAVGCRLAIIGGVRGLVAGGLCLSVPAFELVTTVTRRLRRTGGLVTGDRSHTYDVLARRWASRTRATVILAVAAAAGSMAGVAAAAAPALAAVAVVIGVLVTGAATAAWLLGDPGNFPPATAVERLPRPGDFPGAGGH